jgi:hypothetical protein
MSKNPTVNLKHHPNDPVDVVGVDMYNHQITGNVTMTLCCDRADPHHIPCVIQRRTSVVVENEEDEQPDPDH